MTTIFHESKGLCVEEHKRDLRGKKYNLVTGCVSSTIKDGNL